MTLRDALAYARILEYRVEIQTTPYGHSAKIGRADRPQLSPWDEISHPIQDPDDLGAWIAAWIRARSLSGFESRL